MSKLRIISSAFTAFLISVFAGAVAATDSDYSKRKGAVMIRLTQGDGFILSLSKITSGAVKYVKGYASSVFSAPASLFVGAKPVLGAALFVFLAIIATHPTTANAGIGGGLGFAIFGITANDFTAFMPTFYKGLNTVAQEQTDSIDAVNQNVSLEQAAMGQTINYPIAPVAAAVDTPQTVPAPTYTTAGTGSLVLSKSKSVFFSYNGEDIHQLQLGGVYADFYGDQLKQAVRTLRKLIAADIITAAVAGASRSFGTPGTTPFGTAGVLTGFAGPNKILNDNGAPGSDRHLILGTNSVYNIQGIQSTLYKANEAGTDRLLRTGTIGSVEGFAVGMDTSIQTISTFGNSAGTTAAAYAVGATVITLAVGFTGAPIAGDNFHFTGDTANTYTVASYAAGVITINAPGLMVPVLGTVALVWNTTAGQPNPFFTRDAITLVARMPMIGSGGSPIGQLMDVSTIPDPRCGLIYQLLMWQSGRTIQIEVAEAWGVGVTNPQNLGILWG
jgi:hypothetical protein